MKICMAIAWCLLLGLLSVQTQSRSRQPSMEPQTSQQTVPASTSEQSKIDPAKEADIRRLLDLVGVKALVAQIMNTMEGSMRPLMVNSLPPGEYRDKLIDLFIAKFHSKTDMQHLLDLAVPIYDKYLSHEEIKGLIEFYQTPLGQKTVSVLPKMTGELQEKAGKWGGEMGRQCMLEVLAEHPELEKALEAAQKSTRRQ